MKRSLAVVLVAAAAVAGAVACQEEPPESAYESPTPLPSPEPGVTPVAVALPGDGTLATVTGRIAAPGEADVFTFALVEGERVRIDVDAQGMVPSSTNLDGFLTVYGPGGAVVAAGDDGTNLWEQGTQTPGPLKDAYLIVTAPLTGNYAAVLEDTHRAGGDNEEWDYRVSFSLVQPAVLAGGTACADAVALPALTGTAGVVSVTGTLTAASTDTCCNTQVLPCAGSRVEGPDLTYTATLTSGQRVQIAATGAGFDGAVYVTTDCVGGSNLSIINSCEAGGDGSDASDGVVFTPSVTGSYYIFVDAVSGSSGAFTLDLRRM